MAETSPDLVRRSRAGDSAAFEALYREHVGRVYALCLRMTGDSTLATELTQDVFVLVWRRLHTFRGEAAFATWLHRLAFNVVRQDQRSQSRYRARVSSTDEVDVDSVAAGGLPADSRIDLERAIAELPPRARDALILHDIHGYRCREVAELTGTAVGTIQAHLHRARKLLKKVLEK